MNALNGLRAQIPEFRKHLPSVIRREEAPVDTAELGSAHRGRGQGKHWASRNTLVAGLVAITIVGAGLLAGCSDAVPSTPPPPPEACITEVYQASDLQMEVIPAEIPRVDLRRYTTSETVSDGNGRSHTVTHERPYSDYGVYLGDGVFYDLNGNLALIPQRVEGPLVAADSPLVTVHPTGLLTSDTRVTRSGNQARVEPQAWLIPATVLEKEGCRITIQPEAWGALTQSVERRGNQTTIRQGAFQSPLVMTREDDLIRVNDGPLSGTLTVGLGDDQMLVRPPLSLANTTVNFGDGEITIDRGLLGGTTQIVRHGDQTEIQGPFSHTTLTREPGQLHIERPLFSPTEIHWDAST